jgi:hypothetical protein
MLRGPFITKRQSAIGSATGTDSAVTVVWMDKAYSPLDKGADEILIPPVIAQIFIQWLV